MHRLVYSHSVRNISAFPKLPVLSCVISYLVFEDKYLFTEQVNDLVLCPGCSVVYSFISGLGVQIEWLCGQEKSKNMMMVFVEVYLDIVVRPFQRTECFYLTFYRSFRTL